MVNRRAEFLKQCPEVLIPLPAVPHDKAVGEEQGRGHHDSVREAAHRDGVEMVAPIHSGNVGSSVKDGRCAAYVAALRNSPWTLTKPISISRFISGPLSSYL